MIKRNRFDTNSKDERDIFTSRLASQVLCAKIFGTILRKLFNDFSQVSTIQRPVIIFSSAFIKLDDENDEVCFKNPYFYHTMCKIYRCMSDTFILKTRAF